MKNSKQKHNKTEVLKPLLTLMITLITLPVFSATYYTRQSGNWSSRWTWSTVAFQGPIAATIPGPGDQVIIDRYEVTIDAADVTVSTIQVVNTVGFFGTSAKLTIANGRQLTTTGNLRVTMENVNRTVSLIVKDNQTKLEVFGDLIFERVAGNGTNNEFIFSMSNSSVTTVHGEYLQNNLSSGPGLFQIGFNLNDNAIFECLSDVNINIFDNGFHAFFTDDNSVFRVTGNVTITSNNDEDYWFFTTNSSNITINGNLNFILNGNGGLEIGTDNNNGFNQFHVLGDLSITHNNGGDITISYNREGTIKVDGNFDVNWTGSGGANKTLLFKGFRNGKLDVDGSMNLTMNDPNNANINFNFKGTSSCFIGLNNAQYTEALNINLLNGNNLIMDLDEDSKMTIYGDLITNTNGIGDCSFRLNENINGATTDGQLDVQRHWNLSKTNGKSLNIIAKNNSNFLVRGNLNVSNTGFNNDFIFKNNRIVLYNNSKLEVWSNFSWNTDNATHRVQHVIDLQDNSVLNTGTFTNQSTTLTGTNANSILVYLAGNSIWNASGDFNFECISVAGTSGITSFQNSQLHIGRHLKIDNTSNTDDIGVSILGANSLLSVAGNIDFTKVFRQYGGYVELSSGRFKFGGNVLRNAEPNTFGYIEVGTFGPVLELNGTSPQIIPRAIGNTFNGNKEYGVLLLNNSSNINPQFTLEGNIDINSIEVNANNTLLIGSQKSMTVDTKITNNGAITVENNASIVQTNAGANTNAGTGTYHIKRTGKNLATGYNIWSSPITSANLVTVFDGANPCDMYVFQAASQSWSYDYSPGFSTTCSGNAVTFQAGNVIAGGDGIMDIARGYFAPGNAVSTKTFSGTINNGTVTIPITTTTMGNNPNWNNDDWNLIGNPYPSAINATSFWTENAVNNQRITDGIYYWDDSDPVGGANALADYAYWNMAGGVNSGNSDKTPNGYISSGQGFWVSANANSNLVFNNSMRSNQNSQFFKTTQKEENHNAWFSLESPSGIENNILIGFNPKATDTIDQNYDAHKLEGHTHLRFSSVINNEEFVIQSQSIMQINETRVIPLVLFTDEYGMHTVSEYKRESLSHNYTIFFHDKKLGTMYDLSLGNISVELLPNVVYSARFELIINYEMKKTNGNGTKGTTTSIEELNTNNFKVYQKYGDLHISNFNNKNGWVEVYDLTGKLLIQQQFIRGDIHLSSWSNLAAGSYVVTISQNGKRMYQQNEIKL